MAGQVESLNVGVAAGISIYELRTKLVLGMLGERIRGTIGRDVAVAGRFIRDALDLTMQRAAGLSSAQAIALMVVTAERRTPAATLRRDLGAGADELGDLLAPLLERGWLSYHQGGYASTAEGERALAVLWPVQQQLDEQLLAGFSQAERRGLRELLERVRRNAESLLREPGK